MKARQCFRIVVEVEAQAILDLFRPFVDAGHTLELLRMRPQNELLAVNATFAGIDDLAAHQLVRDILRLPRVRSAAVEMVVQPNND